MAITKVTNSLVATNAIQGTLIADNAITSVHIAIPADVLALRKQQTRTQGYK